MDSMVFNSSFTGWMSENKRKKDKENRFDNLIIYETGVYVFFLFAKGVHRQEHKLQYEICINT